jgi:GR25 family glycosyltransferase involved in LPS biosynthesis
MILAPIVFFAYNRPWHTEQTLLSLIANDLADESVIYFFIDGCKSNANQEQIEKHEQVIEIVSKYKSYFKESYVEISPQNKGLANSVIYGITEVINRYEKVIVLEDDIVTSEGFLQYMNDALDIYEDEKKVAGVSGHSFINSQDPTYFLTKGSCWGWGTWKRVWKDIDFDVDSLLQKFSNKNIIKIFNIGGYPFYKMLHNQKKGLIDSWAIRFYASYFFKGQLFLYPSKTMVLNIGVDEGTHYHTGNKVDINQKKLLLKNVEVIKNIIVEDKLNEMKIIDYLNSNNSNFFYRFLILLKKMTHWVIKNKK